MLRSILLSLGCVVALAGSLFAQTSPLRLPAKQVSVRTNDFSVLGEVYSAEYAPSNSLQALLEWLDDNWTASVFSTTDSYYYANGTTQNFFRAVVRDHLDVLDQALVGTNLYVGNSAWVSNDLTVGDDLVVTDDATVRGNLVVSGATIISNNLTVTGTITGDDLVSSSSSNNWTGRNVFNIPPRLFGSNAQVSAIATFSQTVTNNSAWSNAVLSESYDPNACLASSAYTAPVTAYYIIQFDNYTGSGPYYWVSGYSTDNVAAETVLSNEATTSVPYALNRPHIVYLPAGTVFRLFFFVNSAESNPLSIAGTVRFLILMPYP